MRRLRIVIFPSIAVVVLAALLVVGWKGAWAASNQQSQQLVLHKRACGTWSVVASKNVGTSTNFLYGVAAVSAKNVWAVGSEGNGHGGLTLVEHWNGSQWKVVASPNVKGSLSDSLSGVVAITANNIWAGGRADQGMGWRTLIEHWNGSIWSVVSSPNEGSGDNALFGVANVPATQKAWAVGQYSSTNSQTIFEYHQQ